MNKEYRYTYSESNYREKMAILMDHLMIEQSGFGSYIFLISLFVFSGITFLVLNTHGPGIIVGPAFILVGVVFAFRLFRYLYQKKKYKELLQDAIEQKIEQLNAFNGNVYIGVDDTYFSYADEEHPSKLAWESIHSYLKVEETLFIILEIDPFSAFSINSRDIPPKDFQMVCSFVEKKLTPHILAKIQQKEKKPNPDILDN